MSPVEKKIDFLRLHRLTTSPEINTLGNKKRRRRGQEILLSFSLDNPRWHRKRHLWVWLPKKATVVSDQSDRTYDQEHKTTGKQKERDLLEKKKKQSFRNWKKREGTISMIELFDVLLAITSVLSLVTCTIWCNRCVLEWRLRRRARRRNPGMFRKPAPVTPTKHVVEKPEPLGATPEPEHIYMEIDLEQPPPWDSVAPPPYTRTAATQISYI